MFVRKASRHANVVWYRIVKRPVSGKRVEIAGALAARDTVSALKKMNKLVGDGVVGSVVRVDPDFVPTGDRHPAGGPGQANANALLPKLGEESSDIGELLEDGLVSPVPLQRAGRLKNTGGRAVVELKRELSGRGVLHTA